MSEREMQKIIAQNIQRYMDLRNLTQTEVAEEIGVAQTSVSSWCLGIKMPRMDKIDKLCKLFNCRRSDLMEDHSNDPDAVRNAILQRAAEDPSKRLLFDLVTKADAKETELAVQFMQTLIGDRE